MSGNTHTVKENVEENTTFGSKQCIEAHLEPLPLYQALKAFNGPAAGIQDDLSQGGDLQGGVCPFCTVNKH